MSCKLNHKEALLNSREFLIEQQAIDKLSTILNLQKFEEVNSTLSNDAFNAYGVEGNLWSEKSGRAVPNKSVLKSIDEKRKELGIYDSKEAAQTQTIRLWRVGSKEYDTGIWWTNNQKDLKWYWDNREDRQLYYVDVSKSEYEKALLPTQRGIGTNEFQFVQERGNQLDPNRIFIANPDDVFGYVSDELESVEDFVEEVDYTNQDFIEDRNSIKLQNQLLSDELNLESFDEMFPDMDYLSGAEKLILIKAIEDGKFSISCTI